MIFRAKKMEQTSFWENRMIPKFLIDFVNHSQLEIHCNFGGSCTCLYKGVLHINNDRSPRETNTIAWGNLTEM